MSGTIPPRSSLSPSNPPQSTETAERTTVGVEPTVVNMGHPTQDTVRQHEPRMVQPQVMDRAEQEVLAVKEIATAGRKGIARPNAPGRRPSQEVIPTSSSLRANMSIVADAALRRGPLAWALANPARVAHEALPPSSLADVRGRIIALSNILTDIRAGDADLSKNPTASKLERRSLATAAANRAFEISIDSAKKAAETSHSSSAIDVAGIQQSAVTVSQRLEAEGAAISKVHFEDRELQLTKLLIGSIEENASLGSPTRAKRIGQQLAILIEFGLRSEILNKLASSPAIRTLLSRYKNDVAIDYSTWNAELPATEELQNKKTLEALTLQLTCAGPSGVLKEYKVLGPWVINEYKFDKGKDAGRLLIGLKGKKAIVLAA